MPEGWKAKSDRSFAPSIYYRPDLRVRAGKEFSKTISQFLPMDSEQLAKEVGVFESHIIPEGGQMFFVRSQCYQENGQYIVLCPKLKDGPAKNPIAGLREIKLSEFYALKEKSEKAA